MEGDHYANGIIGEDYPHLINYTDWHTDKTRTCMLNMY